MSETIHSLKTWPEFYRAIISDKKTFEVRFNDRNFQVGDYLDLIEYDPPPIAEVDGNFTGAHAVRRITYILHGPAFGIKAGYCVMGFEKI